MIEQIRHLQAAKPFEPFALELSSGRVVQIYDPHHVATTEVYGQRRGNPMVGILHHDGYFELIAASQIASITAGEHPKVKAELEQRMELTRKIVGQGER